MSGRLKWTEWEKEDARTDGLVLVQLQRLRVVPLERVGVRRFFGDVRPFEGGQRAERGRWGF